MKFPHAALLYRQKRATGRLSLGCSGREHEAKLLEFLIQLRLVIITYVNRLYDSKVSVSRYYQVHSVFIRKKS
jgi:hypothetical protein